jgi:hypothetical protein
MGNTQSVVNVPALTASLLMAGVPKKTVQAIGVDAKIWELLEPIFAGIATGLKEITVAVGQAIVQCAQALVALVIAHPYVAVGCILAALGLLVWYLCRAEGAEPVKERVARALSELADQLRRQL